MITRIHGASSTLAANPRRKHRKAARKARAHKRHVAHKTTHKRVRAKSARKHRKVAGHKLFSVYSAPRKTKSGKKRKVAYRLAKNPAAQMDLPLASKKRTRRKHKRSPLFSVYRSGKGKKARYSIHKARKNPAGLVIAGVPVIEMAIGSVAAIGLGQTMTILLNKYAGDKLPAFLADKDKGVGGELLTAGLAAFLYMKGPKQPMVKEVAKYAFIGSVFQMISKLAHDPIESGLKAIGLTGGSSMGGIYFDPYTAAPAVGGAYLPTTAGTDIGGIYTSVDGLGLFNAPSIYG